MHSAIMRSYQSTRLVLETTPSNAVGHAVGVGCVSARTSKVTMSHVSRKPTFSGLPPRQDTGHDFDSITVVKRKPLSFFFFPFPTFIFFFFAEKLNLFFSFKYISREVSFATKKI